MIADLRSMTGGYLDRWVAGPHVQAASARFGPPPELDQVSDLPELPARVHQGLWIVDCPCGGAEMVLKAHPITWCCSCGNRYCGGLWRAVRMPEDGAEIERLLEVRPFPQSQNWEPGELLSQLAAENAEHGL